MAGGAHAKLTPLEVAHAGPSQKIRCVRHGMYVGGDAFSKQWLLSQPDRRAHKKVSPNSAFLDEHASPQRSTHGRVVRRDQNLSGAS